PPSRGCKKPPAPATLADGSDHHGLARWRPGHQGVIRAYAINLQRRRLVQKIFALACLLVTLATGAAAQDYPTKPVRMIIPFPPGGSNDVVGRMIATHMGEHLGKQVVVDNRSGAGGVIGTDLAASAAPDGYRLLIIPRAHAVTPWLYKLSYDPIKSFSPIGILASGPNVLAINPSLPVNSVKELVALAKQKPGELQYASAGVGSFQHLGSE